MSIYSEIKKYLLFLVGFFCLVLFGHLVLLYIYSDAEQYPLPGGIIHVGLMWEKPNLNILQFDTKISNDTNDTVIRFMQRGLIRFSPADKKIVGDLWTCEFGNFPVVSCRLNQNALWDDGTAMLPADVAATYNFFKEKSLSESMKSALELISVSANTETINFTFKTRDITSIHLLMLPIMREKDLADTWNGILGENISYNGPYIYSSKDNTQNSLLVVRNPFYTHTNRPFYFDQVRFGFGETNKDIYRAINPDIILSDKEDGLSGAVSKYIRPVFWWAFLNTSKLSASFRKTLYHDILWTLDLEDESIFKEENIFLWEVPNTPRTLDGSTFVQTVTSLGFTYGGSIQTPVVTERPASKKNLSYISSPGKESPLFLSNPSIDLSGSIPAGTTRVVVNGYTLRSFDANSGEFTYLIRPEFQNIIVGENTYTVSFYNNDQLIAEESLTIHHNSNTEELAQSEQTWKEANTIKEEIHSEPTASALDPKKLYNADGIPLTIRIVTQSGIPYLTNLTEQIQQKLTDFWVEVVAEEYPMSEIRTKVADQSFTYDILLTGGNLGVFHYNISPFFHSSQIQNGINFSRIKNSTLDTLLTRLTERLYYSIPDKLREIEISIQKILEDESAVFTFWAPYEYVATKRSLLGLNIPEFLAGRELLVDILSRSYFKEGYRKSEEPKTFIGFFVWLKNALFPSS